VGGSRGLSPDLLFLIVFSMRVWLQWVTPSEICRRNEPKTKIILLSPHFAGGV